MRLCTKCLKGHRANEDAGINISTSHESILRMAKNLRRHTKQQVASTERLLDAKSINTCRKTTGRVQSLDNSPQAHKLQHFYNSLIANIPWTRPRLPLKLYMRM